MVRDVQLDEAGARFREAFGEVSVPAFEDLDAGRPSKRRRGRLLVAASIVVIAVVTAGALTVALRRDDGSDSLDVGPVASAPAARRHVVELLGGGPFRFTKAPLSYRVVVDEHDGASSLTPFGHSASRSVRLELADDGGRRIVLEAFDDPSVAADLLAGRFPDGAIATRVGPSRPAMVLHGPSNRLVWAYDSSTIVVVSGPASMLDTDLLDLARGVVADARLANNFVAPSTQMPRLLGQAYLESTNRLAKEGFRVRWTLARAPVTGEPGQVATSDPLPDGPLTPGQVVTLFVVPPTPGQLAGHVANDPDPARDVFSGRFSGVTTTQTYGTPGLSVGWVTGLPGLTPGAAPRSDDPEARLAPVSFLNGELAGYFGEEFIPLDVILDRTRWPPPPTTSTTGSPTPPVSFPYPTSQPDGWATVDEGGIRLFTPPDWRVQRNGCPGAPLTVYVGSGAGCPPPDTANTWVWIHPLPTDLGDMPTTCRHGAVNGIPGCLLQTGTERFLFDGATVLVELSNGTQPALMSPVSSSLQRTPNAPIPNAAPMSGGLGVASQYITAYYANDCEAQWRLSDVDLRGTRSHDSYLSDCQRSAPTGGATIEEATSPLITEAYIRAKQDRGEQTIWHITAVSRYDTATSTTGWFVHSVERYEGPRPIPPPTPSLPK